MIFVSKKVRKERNGNANMLYLSIVIFLPFSVSLCMAHSLVPLHWVRWRKRTCGIQCPFMRNGNIARNTCILPNVFGYQTLFGRSISIYLSLVHHFGCIFFFGLFYFHISCSHSIPIFGWTLNWSRKYGAAVSSNIRHFVY